MPSRRETGGNHKTHPRRERAVLRSRSRDPGRGDFVSGGRRGVEGEMGEEREDNEFPLPSTRIKRLFVEFSYQSLLGRWFEDVAHFDS